jgi:hypothetical protein
VGLVLLNILCRAFYCGKMPCLLRRSETLRRAGVAHPSFNKAVKPPFTLVLHKHQALLPDIKQIITPLGGSVVFDDAFLASHMEPVIRFMYEQLKKGSV